MKRSILFCLVGLIVAIISLSGMSTTVYANGVGTKTPGYWKNHLEAWPVDEIEIGGVPFSKDEAIYWFDQKNKDKTITLFKSLVSAKLNLIVGADVCPILTSTIQIADSWMVEYPVGSGVGGSSDDWYMGEPLHVILDDYNNGYLCAP